MASFSTYAGWPLLGWKAGGFQPASLPLPFSASAGRRGAAPRVREPKSRAQQQPRASLPDLGKPSGRCGWFIFLPLLLRFVVLILFLFFIIIIIFCL